MLGAGTGVSCGGGDLSAGHGSVDDDDHGDNAGDYLSAGHGRADPGHKVTLAITGQQARKTRAAAGSGREKPENTSDDHADIDAAIRAETVFAAKLHWLFPTHLSSATTPSRLLQEAQGSEQRSQERKTTCPQRSSVRGPSSSVDGSPKMLAEPNSASGREPRLWG